MRLDKAVKASHHAKFYNLSPALWGILTHMLEQTQIRGSIGVARIFDWGGAQTTNHMQ